MIDNEESFNFVQTFIKVLFDESLSFLLCIIFILKCPMRNFYHTFTLISIYSITILKVVKFSTQIVFSFHLIFGQNFIYRRQYFLDHEK